jgi:hypothetical protein
MLHHDLGFRKKETKSRAAFVTSEKRATEIVTKNGAINMMRASAMFHINQAYVDNAHKDDSVWRYTPTQTATDSSSSSDSSSLSSSEEEWVDSKPRIIKTIHGNVSDYNSSDDNSSDRTTASEVDSRGGKKKLSAEGRQRREKRAAGRAEMILQAAGKRREEEDKKRREATKKEPYGAEERRRSSSSSSSSSSAWSDDSVNLSYTSLFRAYRRRKTTTGVVVSCGPTFAVG